MTTEEQDRPSPFVLGAHEGEPGFVPEGSEMLVKASRETTGGLFGLVVGVDKPGFATIAHRHDVAEAWYVLDGSYRYFVDGRWFTAGPGAFVFVPAGAAHGMRCVSDGGRKITLFVPGGTEGFFRDVHAAHEAGTLGPDPVRELGERYGLQVLGPLPPDIDPG
jgi:mannose-6-phosphate isomerase-like protein (cupin superfamily)